SAEDGVHVRDGLELGPGVRVREHGFDSHAASSAVSVMVIRGWSLPCCTEYDSDSTWFASSFASTPKSTRASIAAFPKVCRLPASRVRRSGACQVMDT